MNTCGVVPASGGGGGRLQLLHGRSGPADVAGAVLVAAGVAAYQAATVPDEQATTDKKAFAALWTAIANEYGLPSYQYNQI